jgi:hypothetical protein
MKWRASSAAYMNLHTKRPEIFFHNIYTDAIDELLVLRTNMG